MKGIKGLELSMSSATTMQSADAEWSPRRLRAMPNKYLEITVTIIKKLHTIQNNYQVSNS